MISEHLERWLELPVHPLNFESIAQPVPDLRRTVCRLHTEWESPGNWTELFHRFLALPHAEESAALIVGAFAGDDTQTDSAAVVEALVNAYARLPALRGLFLGDIVSEECEVSWINQSDVAPLFAAFPRLEHFAVRGGTGLAFGRIRHAALRSLVVQTGGLGRAVLADLARAELPALEHLELWLGHESYGWDGTIADVRPFLQPGLFPRLRHLALSNSEIQDEIAAAVAASPLVAQLETLDLSKGTLTDAGAGALLAQPALKRLRKLDLHHHYLSDDVMARVRAEFPQADVSKRQDADEYDGETYRHVAVAE